MKNRLISILIVSLLVIGGFIGVTSTITDEVEASGPTYFKGLISVDTTWTLANSPYIITGNSMVEKSVTLTVETGVEVRFDGYYYLQIEGKLVAEGTENDIITFTSNKTSPAPGDWNAIRFMNNCDIGSSIKYCKIEYSSGSFSWGVAINIEGGIPSIAHNYITNCGGGICLRSEDPYQGTFYVMNNIIKYNWGHGIIINEYASKIGVELSNNVINNNSGSGIWIRSRRSSEEFTSIKNNTIQDNMGGGIWFVASNAYINVTNNLVTNNTWGGIVFQVGSNEIPGVLEKNTIINNEDGIRLDGAESPVDYSWQYNNIYDNIGYNVKNTDVNDWYLINNWWGTTNTDLINQSIFDYYDDFNYGKVIYMPFLKESSKEKTIRLKHGCNMISIPFIQPDEGIDEVLSSISGEYYAVQWYNSADTQDPWKHHHSSKPLNTNDLDTIDHTMAIFIYLTSPDDTIFTYKGYPPTVNQTIQLYPGWNLVGYPSLTSYKRTEGLNNLEFGVNVDCIQWFDAITKTWNFMGPDDSFEPGRGYWVHSMVETTWEVPL